MPQKQTAHRRQADGDGRASDEGGEHSAPSMGRLDRIEAAIESIQHTLDVQFKRIAAMQAEIDLLRAKDRSS